jgi:hypothetical protein
MVGISHEEHLFDAHDAYSSTLLLAALVFCSQVINIGAAFALTPPLLLGLRGLVLVYALVVLLCLGVTLRRPSIDLAERLQAVLLGGFLVLVPVAATLWKAAGRPWEIPPLVQPCMVAVALAAPRSMRLCVALIGALLIEAIALHVWLLHSGTPRELMSLGEPGSTVTFAFISIAVLILRRRRRALALRHLKRSADALALAHLASQLQEVATEVRGAAGQLGAALGRLGGEQAVVSRVSRAIDRITHVSDGLSETVKTHAPAPTTDDEVAYHARDAHESAFVVSVVVALATFVAFVNMHGENVGALPLFYVVDGSLATASAVALWLTRRRPSRAFADTLFVLVVLPVFVQVCYAVPQWARPGVAFQALLGPKMFLLVVPLVMPRRPWMAILLELGMATISISLFYIHHLDQMVDRMTSAEPYNTVFYLMIGLALVTTRENRRAMSVSLMRADAQAVALVTSTTVSLKLLHELGTPLQVLSMGVELLKDEDGATVVRVREALARLVAATRQVPPADPEVFRHVGESFQNV